VNLLNGHVFNTEVERFFHHSQRLGQEITGVDHSELVHECSPGCEIFFKKNKRKSEPFPPRRSTLYTMNSGCSYAEPLQLYFPPLSPSISIPSDFTLAPNLRYTPTSRCHLATSYLRQDHSPASTLEDFTVDRARYWTKLKDVQEEFKAANASQAKLGDANTMFVLCI
jgi:hypothetical protein